LKFYFDKIIDLLGILNLSIYWETPSNMSVSMNIMKMNSRRISTKLLRSSKPITILIPTENLDFNSIKTGFMPNFIHSLDASNIHLLIKLISLLELNKLNLYTIHDCFATDYKNMAILEVLIKKSFSDIYFNENYLNILHQSFFNQIRSITNIFEENNNNFILINIKDIKDKKKISKFEKIDNKHIKIYLPNLPEYKWNVNTEIMKRELMFNPYFVG
jgi:DNA-directed RNA polymerase